MKKVFVFDVDGTLTGSREHIDLSFKKWLKTFVRKNNAYIATGSDYPKTLEQMGSDILNMFDGIFCCNGNSIFVKGKKIYASNWSVSDQHITWLNDALQKSLFTNKTGRHIEKRDGLVNFSVVGRNASKEERRQYVDFDRRTKERQRLVDAFNRAFEHQGIVAAIGGETGFDITQKGKDKSQIAEYFKDPSLFVYFFGDSLFFGGNDYPLAERLRAVKPNAHKIYAVKGWKDTWKHLRTLEKIDELMEV